MSQKSSCRQRVKVDKPLLWRSATAFVRLLSGRHIAGVVKEFTLNGVELLTGDGSLYVELWEVDSLHCS